MKREVYTQVPEIVEKNRKARLLAFQYNSISPDNVEEKENFLKRCLGKTGAGCSVYSPFLFDMGENIFLGDNVFINYNCVILDMAHVHIGNNVMIAPNVTLSTASHLLSRQSRRNKEGFAEPIVIEDDVWIGCNVSILPGVTIGAGSVIAAGAVVTKSVPANCLVAGVPARIMRKLEDE